MRKEVKVEVMETTGENCTVTNAAHSIWKTEEVLLPFFNDESLQAAMNTQHANTPAALPELRLVLLGRKGTGKSSAGNTVLAGVGGFESGKPTEECVKRRADVERHRVTVVDTPGWEWYYPLNSTPNWVRRETLRSVTLCPPGPHAVLLVVRSCASVTEDYIGEIEEHLEPLGEGVWEHTMVLFTRGDELGLVSMEQRILTSGSALRKLLQKCGNRYHVVDNRSKGDGTQVKELIRKLEEMVDGKEEGRKHFEVGNAVLLSLEADGKRRARERRKKQRQMEAQVQRGSIKAALMSDGVQGSELDARQSLSKAPRRLPEVRLVLLGERETGKSSVGNAILGGGRFFQVGAVTEECTRQQAEVAARLVTVVDTPGWEGGAAGVTTERVKREIVSSVALCPPGPHALLLNLRVDTLVRVGHVREHLELLGEGVWRHTILLFTYGDQLRAGVDIEQHIQSGGRDLQWLMEKCRGRYHVISSVEAGGRGGGGSAQVTELLEKVEKMAAGNRCEAFSELVQEVRDLGRKRNETFNQRLKEVSDKRLRQEAELKRMRDREMRSFRWLFERRRKVKLPGKADVEREEEEDGERRSSERRNENGDLEERMRWLTEDKEREIQDLSVENDRILAALRQSSREREEALLKLELREREIDELKEKIDEQQLKLLDLERAIVEKEHERKQRAEGDREREEGWVREVERCTEGEERHRKEKAEWIEKVHSLKAETEERKKRHDDVVLKAQEKERKMEGEMKRRVEELKEKEREVQEKEEEIESIKQQHQEELAEKLNEREEDFERVKQQHEDELREIEREKQRDMKELRQEIERLLQERDKEMTELEGKHLRQIEEKMRQSEKEKEMIRLCHEKEMKEKMLEREKEEDALKVLLEEGMVRKASEIEKVRSQQREEINRKQKETEEEVEKVKQRCGAKIKAVEQEREEEIKELRRQFARDTEKRLQEKERKMAETEEKYAAKMEERKQENKKEMERVNAKHGKRMQEREREIEEISLKVEELKGKLQQKEEKERDYKRGMEQKVEESERETEQMRQQVKDIEGILQRKEEERGETILDLEKEAERRMREREREVEEMREKLLSDAEREVKERESEVESIRQQREAEIDEAKKASASYLTENARLRGTIEQTKSGLKKLTERMEKEMTCMIREYEREIARRDESAEAVAREEEEFRREVEKRRGDYESREEEVRKHLGRYEEEVKTKEAEIRILRRERDLEVGALKQMIDKLETQIDGMKKREGECERKLVEMKEKQREQNVRNDAIGEEFLRRERELGEREENLSRDEEVVRKRGRELDAKEEELVEKEGKLEGRERECRKREANLEAEQKLQEEREKGERDLTFRAEKVERKERELESKQQELNVLGQELEKKVKGLKHRGKGLEDEESDLKNEEQELLSLRSELQQLHEMGRDLATLREELRKREAGLKVALERLSKREQGVEEREEELRQREQNHSKKTTEVKKSDRDLCNGQREVEFSAERSNMGVDERDSRGESHVTYQELSVDGRERRGKGKERDSDLVILTDWEDQRVKPAESAAENIDCQLESLKERKMREEKGGAKGETIEGAKVVRCFSSLSPSQGHGFSTNKGSPESDLRVLLLGETWSSRHPAGVTILGGEVTQPDESSLRRWRVQIAGRRLTVAEPGGLRWRDGPDPTAASQRQSILDSATWGPHAVLLVVPAFLSFTRQCRRAVEEHVGLLGEGVWRRTLVLLTWGETLGESAEQHFLRNGELMAVVEQCGGRFHVLTSKNNKRLIEGLLEKIEDVVDPKSA